MKAASYNMLGLVAYNLQTGTVVGSMATNDRPDHVSTSPSGKYCVPSWDSVKGTRAYALNFATFTQLHSKSEHSDLAQTKKGKDVYVFSDYISGFVVMVDMETGVKTNLIELYGPNSSATAMHISGVSKNKPGYVTIGFYACSTNYGAAPCPFNTQWFNNKVVVVELNASPKIYNLAHTHYGDAGYFSESQSVPNSDLTKVLFVSTWGSANENDVTSYMINVPAGSLP